MTSATRRQTDRARAGAQEGIFDGLELRRVLMPACALCSVRSIHRGLQLADVLRAASVTGQLDLCKGHGRLVRRAMARIMLGG